uniref:Methyltransferase n=1 Tax=Panagrellus redivivus TaxID=6233 RepID=A0A7E4VTI6_PANRE
MICNAPVFKALKSFDVKEPTFPSVSTWIETFVEAECTSLERFEVTDAILSSFEIDKKIFLKFFKAQRDNFIFIFSLAFETDWYDFTKLLENLLGEHFECGEIDDSKQKKAVHVHFKTGMRWEYTLRNDLTSLHIP